jgi:hypothetical protein
VFAGRTLKFQLYFHGPSKTKTGWGAHMEIIGIVGFVFAAVAVGTLIYEREMDVLHGRYIEGSEDAQEFAAVWNPMLVLVDRLNWKARNAVYLASLA